ncbi:MAG: carboxypeptidase regulatory-like domain-containing protein, partial [Planctomycetia bacterium]|nr:carboxypeptidase regulatory-like domain-containing protein [Planctomycetia bacterium]
VRVVAATLPAGLTNTFGGAQQGATIANASTDLSKDFGYQPSGTIGGRVFNDVDGDGTTDAGEPGIPGAVVELVDANGDVIATTTTGPDGTYTFDHLPDGAYTVRVQPGSVPAGLNATTPTSLPAVISNGADVTGLNFGYDSPTGAIGDRVWFDVDGDGVQDAGEAGIAGVTLELVNAAGQVIATEVTNSAGSYLFVGLADGTYTVRVVAATLPAGLTNTFGGTQQSATVLNASTDLSKDFGYQPSGTISGRVFNDVDGDGTTDAGEPGIPGAVVELVDANGDVIATTTTGPDGTYTFDHLPDGAYTVRVQPGSVPAGLNATTPTSLPAVISNGADVTGLNFGYDSPTGAIGDRVWFDVDGDGVQDAGEAGIPGVTLELVNAAGQVIATEVTNSAGGYLFDGLADGTYTVRVVQTTLPAGLTNTFGGAQQSATIANASTDLSKDFGYQPSGTISGRVFNDVDGDGTTDAGEPGIPGAVVELV